MIVLITSSTPKRSRKAPAIAAHAPPATAPAVNMTGIPMNHGTPPSVPLIAVAATAPTSNCPSAPILRMPARNATDTARPANANGTMRTIVADVIA